MIFMENETGNIFELLIKSVCEQNEVKRMLGVYPVGDIYFSGLENPVAEYFPEDIGIAFTFIGTI